MTRRESLLPRAREGSYAAPRCFANLAQRLAKKNARRADWKIFYPPIADKAATLVKRGGAFFKSIEIDADAAARAGRFFPLRQQAAPEPLSAPTRRDI